MPGGPDSHDAAPAARRECRAARDRAHPAERHGDRRRAPRRRYAPGSHRGQRPRFSADGRSPAAGRDRSREYARPVGATVRRPGLPDDRESLRGRRARGGLSPVADGRAIPMRQRRPRVRRASVDTDRTALRVIIVDDEPLARDALRSALASQADVVVIGECASGLDAITMIRSQRPDVVFLDVQMPEIDGFGVVFGVGVDEMPPVVMVTAHDQFALKAFEVHAVDYLLKPYTRARLAEALKR